VITHEREIAARFPRRIALLDGRIVADGDGSHAHAADRPEQGRTSS
jgi:hypothetical protein